MSIELTRLPPLLRFDGMCRLPSFTRILLVFLATALITHEVQGASRRVFNVRDYGATGQKVDDARRAIQKAIDACAAAGGGTVVLPSGQYTAGTVHLRSHVRVHLDAGAILYAAPETNAYECGNNFAKATLFS